MIKGSNSPFFLNTLFFIFFFFTCYFTLASPTTKHLCNPNERDALLEFKGEFQIKEPPVLDILSECLIGFFSSMEETSGQTSNEDIANAGFLILAALSWYNPQPKTVSWRLNNSNCCSWDGITCDAHSGKVVGINLSYSFLEGPLRSNSSLFRLRHLRSLDLSFNNLSGKIPSSLGNLSHLTSVDLSFNNLFGEVPSSIGRLDRLTELALHKNVLVGNIPLTLLNLTKLSRVSLDMNSFTGFLPSNMTVFSRLERFSAAENSFFGGFPSSLFTIPSLALLDLSENLLNGPLEFKNISSPFNLKSLGLGHNYFVGAIPESISKFVNLEVLDLSHLDLSSMIDLSVFSPLKSLVSLRLSGNEVSTENNISEFSFRLEGLELSECGIREFPHFIKPQREMHIIDLSGNKLQGQVPDWLWKLPVLMFLNLSHNYFTGFEGSPEFLSGERIINVDISSNMFQGPLPIPPLSTTLMFASSNNFTGEISESVCQCTTLQFLDLSRNGFNGTIPRCLGNLDNSSLQVLILRENNLTGRLPKIRSGFLSILDVGHNKLEGKLPESLIHCKDLQVLNVESNSFNGTFPFWLTSMPSLEVVVLRSNKFHGSVFPPEGSLEIPELRILDLSHNHFNGVLPPHFFANWSAVSSIGTHEDRNKVKYIGYGTFYYHMVLTTKGVTTALERIITTYTTIDLSWNRFGGRIPESIGLLKDLVVLNLANNAFTGHIPGSLANVTELESLDLSSNKLSGEIPPNLASLSFLEYMTSFVVQYHKVHSSLHKTSLVSRETSDYVVFLSRKVA